jgi:hypothetical protein
MPNTEIEFELPCAYRYPPSLVKAASDPFTYLLKLRTGEVIRFMRNARFTGITRL